MQNHASAEEYKTVQNNARRFKTIIGSTKTMQDNAKQDKTIQN